MVEAYTGLSHSFRALAAYTAESCFNAEKYRPRIDIRRRYGYNTYRVRPKRSAVDTVLELPYLGNNRPDDSRAVIYVGTL